MNSLRVLSRGRSMAQRVLLSRYGMKYGVVNQRPWLELLNEESQCASRNPIIRRFSSTTGAAVESPKESEEGKKKDDSNAFFDNIGSIFLTVILLIILVLVRSSFGNTNKYKVRDDVETASALDPFEIDDLRDANTEFTPEVFRRIMDRLEQDFPNGTATYDDVIKSVRTIMMELKGEAFTIQLGHLMDRAVLYALKAQEKPLQEEHSVVFWLTVLSLALSSSSVDRIRILFEVLERNTGGVTLSDVVTLVQYLKDTSQLIPEVQVSPADRYIPTQQYRLAKTEELVLWEGSKNDPIDVQAFADILQSNSVCAWGECYLKLKPPIK